MILSTHIVSDIESIATQIAVMKEGALVSVASPEQILGAACGSVWETVVNSADFDELRRRLKISSAVRKPDGVHLRLVCRRQPAANAALVEPSLTGKFLGNLVFLLALCVGFLASALVMFLLRGETALQVSVFLWCYLLLLVPAGIYTAVMALVFESVPFLSGKLGDVLYFFAWSAVLTAGAATAIAGGKAIDPGRLQLAPFLDPAGIAFLIEQLRGVTNSDSFTVGHTPFDPSLQPILLPDMRISWFHLLPRLSSALLPIPALLIALGFFHRFDPVRVRIAQARASRGLPGRLNSLLKPLSRSFSFGLSAVGRTSRFPLLRGVVADSWLACCARAPAAQL